MSAGPILIEELGRPVKVAPSADPVIDAQDFLIAIGIASGEAAALVIWWPAALIFTCVLSFGFAFLTTMGRRKKAKSK